MAATTNMLMMSKGRKSNAAPSLARMPTESEFGDSGGGLVRIQARVRGRYQRRLLLKQKREAREEARLEAELAEMQEDYEDAYDEFGNKKGLGHLMAEYAPNASSAKIHILSPQHESEKDLQFTKNQVRFGASTRDMLANVSVRHPEPDDQGQGNILESAIDPVGLSSDESLRTEKMNEKRAQVMYQNAIQRTFDAKLKRSKSVVKGEVQSLVAHYRQIMKADSCLLLPDSKHMQNWDKVTVMALLYTAVVTPYEVAFLETTPASALFWINQVVNLVFVVDMFMQFFIPYKQTKAQGGQWVKSKCEIAKHYFRTWFVIDILSILPFDELAMAISGGENDGFGQLLDLVKIIRLLRLLKLFRVLKASRVYKRWEARVAIPYAYVALMKFSVLLIVMGHWMACGWALVAALQSSFMWTWRDQLAFQYEDFDPGYTYSRDVNGTRGHEVSPDMLYSASLYWAITTITSVGYGDITPQNADEMRFCTFFLLIGSILWAYIIGNACGIASSLDVDNIRHHQTMDALNYFMHDQLVPHDERVALRSFFNHSKDLARNESYKGLIDRMSPELKAVVSKRRAAWLYKVSYFRNMSNKFIVNVTHELTASVFVPGEVIEWSNVLFSISKGIASRKGRIYLEGSHWGDDFILETNGLKDMTPSRSLTYSEVVQLERDILFEILEDFPDEQEQIRKRIMKMACARGILRAAKLIKELLENPAVDIVAESNGVLANTFHEGVRDSFSWQKHSAAPRRAVSAPGRASIIMPKVTEDEATETDEAEELAESDRRMTMSKGTPGDEGSRASSSRPSITRSDSINSSPEKRQSLILTAQADARAKARQTFRGQLAGKGSLMKRQMDKFHSEIGMMKESINDTRDSMENLEEKVNMILGLMLQNGAGDKAAAEKEGPINATISHSRSSPALGVNSDGASSPLRSPKSELGILGSPGRKVQLAPLTDRKSVV